MRHTPISPRQQDHRVRLNKDSAENPHFDFRSTLRKGAAANAMLPIEKCLRCYGATTMRKWVAHRPYAGLRGGMLVDSVFQKGNKGN